MEFDWSPEEDAFRQEIREFIAKELTDEARGSIFIDTPARVAFVDKMAQKGWLGLGFPEEYGGSPNPFPLAQFILTTELDLAETGKSRSRAKQAITTCRNIGAPLNRKIKYLIDEPGKCWRTSSLI